MERKVKIKNSFKSLSLGIILLMQMIMEYSRISSLLRCSSYPLMSIVNKREKLLLKKFEYIYASNLKTMNRLDKWLNYTIQSSVSYYDESIESSKYIFPFIMV